MTMGLGVVGASTPTESDAPSPDATPLAQLIEEQEGVLVPADSPFKTVDDLVEAWKEDPGSIAVGGGSTAGGPGPPVPDAARRAEVGIDPNDVNYVSYDGGGPLTSALLGEKIDVGFSGLGEFEGQIEDGELRVLAVSGEERYGRPFADIPTLTEAGVDLVFTNWRGVLAPPEITDERTRGARSATSHEMHDTPGWQDAAGARTAGPTTSRPATSSTTFIDEQDDRVARPWRSWDWL